MSTGCFDKRPAQPRNPIYIAGELVRRNDRLSKEAAKCIVILLEEIKKLSSLVPKTG